jgi:hypothetical protein
MTGYNLFYVPLESDGNGGDFFDGEPLFLHLSYGSWREANDAKATLETLYGIGRIEIDVRAAPNTFMPGEGM